eukprot:TRINITY_DN6588_c0_g1_i1.p1 TRINITY_DN6588_c0_g1~~TRINITY_DN6588_c0_g1_i1.p1  ORF type:complete len:781 (+),score=270.88 TRINITY_DN6588_c0_g1_i1:166-2508(+)
MSDFLKKRKVGDMDFNPIEYNGPQVKKAKRGRPRKHPLPVPAQPTVSNTNVLPAYTMLAPVAAVKPLSGPPSPNIPLVSRDQLTPAVKPRRPRSSSGAGIQESPTNKPNSEDTKAKKSALLARVTSLPVVSLKGKPAPLIKQDHVENTLPLSWRRKAKFASISATLYGSDKLGKEDDELKRMELDLDSDLGVNLDKPRRGRPPKRGRGRPPKNSDLPNMESGSDMQSRMNGQGAHNYADPDYELDEQTVQPSEYQYMSRRAPPLRTIISNKDWPGLYEQFVKQFGSVKEATTELSQDALEQFYFKMLDILERHTTPKEEIDLLRDETRDIREELAQSLHDGLQHVESCRVKLQLELQQLRLKLHSDQMSVRQHNANKLDALLQHLEQQMNLDRMEIARQIKKIREDSERYLTIPHVPTPPPLPNMAMSGPAMMNSVPSVPNAALNTQRDQQLRAQRELASKQHQQAADLYNQAVQLFTPAPYHPGYMSPHQMNGPHMPGSSFNQGYEGYMSQHNIEIPRSFVTSQRSPVTAPNLAFPTHLPTMHGSYKPQELQMTHVMNYHETRPQLPPLINYQENASVTLPPIADRVPSPVKSRDALSSTSNPDRRDAESRDQMSEKSEAAPMQVEEKSTSQNAENSVTRVNEETEKMTDVKETPAPDTSMTPVTTESANHLTPTEQSKNSNNDADANTPMTGVTSESAPTPAVPSTNSESTPLTELPEAVTHSYDMLVQSLQQLTGNASLTAEQLSELIAQQSGVVWDEEQVQEEGSVLNEAANQQQP